MNFGSLYRRSLLIRNLWVVDWGVSVMSVRVGVGGVGVGVGVFTAETQGTQSFAETFNTIND